jgi:hypothetical protein
LFLAIQLVPVNRTNPTTVGEPAWDSPVTKATARAACFDCHSHETNWPWYSYIAPISWLIADDVKKGREALNFSDISEDDSVSSLVKRINNGTMPPPKYLTLHPEARLSDAQKQAFIAGLRTSFRSQSESPADK